MIHEFTPALFLLVAALLVFGGGRIARQFGRPEALGCGVALCIIAIAIGLSPATWRAAWAGWSSGDRLLTSARIVGMTGMLFLAGTRFHFATIRWQTDLMSRTIIAAAVAFVLFVIVATWTAIATDFSSTVLLAASVIASSLWFSGECRRAHKNEYTIKWQAAAAVFTACAFVAVYFFDILSVTRRSSSSVFTHIIVGLNEAVKLFVLFGFAHFISGRFLSRARGRVSALRTTTAFVLIAVLIFGLIFITTNQLGAFAWAFVAGAMWRCSETGMGFGETNRPAAAALLMTLAFVPLTLQTHGRDLNGWPIVAVFVVVAVGIKALFAWLSIKTGTFADSTTKWLALALAGPGEIALALLGFGVTRWSISGPPYFLIVSYALISTVLIPSFSVSATAADSDRSTSDPAKGGGKTCFRMATH